MKSTEHWLVHDHTQIENLLTDFRKDAEIYDWWSLGRILQRLIEQLSHHMAQEEEILFPAYDKKCDTTYKLTTELQAEHDQIFECVQDIRALINKQDKDRILDRIGDLITLMVDHGRREEENLIPFASHLLYEDREELSEKLENFVLTKNSRVW